MSGAPPSASGDVGEVLGRVLLSSLEKAEEKLDAGACGCAARGWSAQVWPHTPVCAAELQRLETLDEDDIEAMRRKRLESLKRVHQQRQEWIGAAWGRVGWPA